MIQPGLIFDGDDTLWMTQPLYAAAKNRFFESMSGLGFPEMEVRKVLESIDVEAVGTHGFSRHRFPSSLLAAYRSMCSHHGLEPRKPLEDSVLGIGYSVFETRPEVANGAQEVLAALETTHRLILATKGDHEIQEQKIEYSGLAGYFHSIYILDDKADHQFVEIVAEQSLTVEESWSIGNSLRSDINPALRVGLGAIWIPQATWAYEDDVMLKSERLHRVHSLEEILPLLI